MCGFEKYVISEQETYLEALRLIDGNRKGFAIAIDARGSVSGTLTDGDIRRAILLGRKLGDRIEPNRDFSSVGQNSQIADMIDVFKDASIDFLPILDSENKCSCTVKKQATENNR